MGRTYAGILGPLAFALVLARSAVQGAGLEASLLAACAWLFAFAAAGWLAGKVAEHLVNESVRSQFQQAMAQWKPPSDNTQTGNTKNR